MKRKATEVRRDKRRKLIAEALEEGLVYREIQNRFKKMGFKPVSLGTITNDVRIITAEWRESRVATIEDRVQAEMVRLLELDAIAAQEWEDRMAGKRIRKKTKRQPLFNPVTGEPIKGKDGKQKIVVTEEVEEVAWPDRGYLETRRAISGDIAKLFGLPAPVKHQVDGKVAVGSPIIDKIEKAFSEAELRELLTRLRKHNEKNTKAKTGKASKKKTTTQSDPNP